ncbi:FkbM family methyltransferase [Microvirga arabica]|uniref:FkbM family methyltransferase n=1 Tax=Microvirga arabica TaxID=1128671 RepID=UPI001939A604|nr:FkbM family methyltransferase [Microvirga arabica]MBM1175077.1 FkbM family methyltransferase [Microvirga arabica]
MSSTVVLATGGTTINFADAVGPEGRVYSFEFMPDNIDVYHANVHANPRLQNRISLVNKPVWSETGRTMSIVGEGPATQVQFADIPDAMKVTAITIDDFVETAGLPHVDLIKMDIEGAEMNALKGAARTIERFKPRIAVCIYHQLFDFYELPQFLLGIREDYKLYSGHSTTHGDESVIFAI